MLFLIDFRNAFISVPLNISDIEPEEDSDTDKSEELNMSIQIYLVFEREYKEFIIIDINFNTTKNDDEKYPYKENNLYFEPNNVGHYNII